MLYLKSILSAQIHFDPEIECDIDFEDGYCARPPCTVLLPERRKTLIKNPFQMEPLFLAKPIQRGDLFTQISPNILPLSLLLYNEGSLHRFNVFQTKNFPQFNTKNLNFKPIELQFQNYFADILEFGTQNIFDTSFINTLMYGFLKYLEFQENMQSTAKIQPIRPTTLINIDNRIIVALIQSLDPMKLILGQDYRFLDGNTLKYMENFMVQSATIRVPNKFALYLKELMIVLENIKNRYGPTIPTSTPIENLTPFNENTQSGILAQYLNSSSYVYLQQFTNSVKQLADMISKADKKKQQFFANMQQSDIFVFIDKPKDPATTPYSSAQFILSEVVPPKP